MFGLGAGEVVVIAILALIVLGPQKLPEAARHLARLMGDLRRVSDEVRRNWDDATREAPGVDPASLPPSTHHAGPLPDSAPSATTSTTPSTSTPSSEPASETSPPDQAHKEHDGD